MKKHIKVLILTLCTAIAACDDEPVMTEPEPVSAGAERSGLFILSEGLFNQNNSTLAWFDTGKGQLSTWEQGSVTSTDVFMQANGRRLGDTANDMLLYGSKLYIAVNVSSTIEILDASNCKSLKQIKMTDADKSREPRYLAAEGGKVYVCNYDGTVSRIDTLTMQIDGNVKVGRNPDGICCAAGKLYVSNSGALDFSNPDSTVSVIDISSFTEIKRIPVRKNPGSIGTDGASVYVISRGIYDYERNDYDCRMHRIDTYYDEVAETYDIQATNLTVSDGKVWLYGYSDNSVTVMDTYSGQILTKDFLKDGPAIGQIYGLDHDPLSSEVFICDAKDYVTPGSLHCYDAEGRHKYTVNGVGINPNGIQFGNAVTGGSGTRVSGLPDRVIEYRPAPGQFVNLMPEYEEGDDAARMAEKCLETMLSGGTVSLGGFGGSITVAFSRPISNLAGEYDFELDGNAFPGSCEPGVVWVSADADGNGLADDPWYEIAGSEHLAGRAKTAAISYTRPTQPDGDILWTCNGTDGCFSHNSYHAQSYWPQWIEADALQFTATLLPDNLVQEGSQWKANGFDWGYADNSYTGTEGCKFDLDWAVDADGQPAGLQQIHFIKVVTGVLGSTPLTGELSTEVSLIKDLHPSE